jgi:hypothetical protein
MTNYQQIVESAGAEFIDVDERSVRFRDPKTGSILSLYRFALRSTQDIHFALKNAREPVVGFEPLVPTE